VRCYGAVSCKLLVSAVAASPVTPAWAHPLAALLAPPQPQTQVRRTKCVFFLKIRFTYYGARKKVEMFTVHYLDTYVSHQRCVPIYKIMGYRVINRACKKKILVGLTQYKKLRYGTYRYISNKSNKNFDANF
jgi:hypothetical protein